MARLCCCQVADRMSRSAHERGSCRERYIRTSIRLRPRPRPRQARLRDTADSRCVGQAVMNPLVTRWRILRVLRGIERGLADSDPRLVGLFAAFTRLTRGEDMPGGEKLGGGRNRMLTRPRAAVPNEPPAFWRSWLWTSVLFILLAALPYSVTIGGTGPCVIRACAQRVEHLHGDRRSAKGQAAFCVVYPNRHLTPASCQS